MVETDEEWLEHLLRLRALRDETAVSPRSSPGATSPITPSRAGSEADRDRYSRTLAVARIVLDNFDNLQASVTQGGKVGQWSPRSAPTTWAA